MADVVQDVNWVPFTIQTATHVHACDNIWFNTTLRDMRGYKKIKCEMIQCDMSVINKTTISKRYMFTHLKIFIHILMVDTQKFTHIMTVILHNVWSTESFNYQRYEWVSLTIFLPDGESCISKRRIRLGSDAILFHLCVYRQLIQ